MSNVFLWGHPRSLSTAMEVYFRARGDFRVIHEPFAGSYWLDDDAATVLDGLLKEAANPPVFVKDIAHHLPDELLANESLIRAFRHVILFRSPLPTFHSHLAVNPEVRSWEFGYETLYRLVGHIRSVPGVEPIFLLAEDLQASPGQTIRALCTRLGIPHLEQAMSWKSEMNSDWRAGRTWQVEAGRSTGFNTAPRTDLPPVPESHRQDFEHHLRFYDLLLAEARQQANP